MDDQHSDSLETSLRKFKIRQTEIAKEIRDDIAEMQDDLTRIVSEFTSLLTEKTETEVTFTSCRISDVELQLHRLEETKSMISSFAEIFKQFNTMTSKILAADTNPIRQLPSSQVKAGFITQTAEDGVETILSQNLHELRRGERTSYSSDHEVLLTETLQRHPGGDYENDMIVASAERLSESSSKKRNYLDVGDPDRLNITGKQNCMNDGHSKQ
jgi:predicted nuclease with TOPRIM domain